MNPLAVASGIESGSVKQSPLQMMALFVPVPFIMLCFLLIFLGILMFAAFANEKISGTFRSNAGWPGLIRQTDIN
jgi:hypothetical protein